MKFKAVKIIGLLVAVLGASQMTLAEEMPESPKQKEARIESNLNLMLVEALKAAGIEMDADKEVAPFAFIIKRDGSLGFFTSSDNNKGLSVDEQSARIRRMLKDMASTQQIDASVQVMYGTLAKENQATQQGLFFEVEHREGVSLLRFLPVTEILDETGKKNGKLKFELDKLSTAKKPQNVFAASIVQ